MSEHHFGTDDLFDVTADLDKAAESDAIAGQMHEAFDRTGTTSVFSDFFAPQASEEPVEASAAEGDMVIAEELTATEKRILGNG